VKAVDQIVLSGTAAQDHCKLSHWKPMGLHICNRDQNLAWPGVVLCVLILESKPGRNGFFIAAVLEETPGK